MTKHNTKQIYFFKIYSLSISQHTYFQRTRKCINKQQQQETISIPVNNTKQTIKKHTTNAHQTRSQNVDNNWEYSYKHTQHKQTTYIHTFSTLLNVVKD